MKTTKVQALLLQKAIKAAVISYTASTLFLVACGGGGGPTCTEAPARTFTPTQISAMAGKDATSLTDVEIISMGDNFKLLSNEALSNLSKGVSNLNIICTPHQAQIYSIKPEQIAQLSPAQVRKIGSSTDGSGVAKLQFLNIETFKRLVSDPIQVAAITADEFKNLPSSYFALIGLNIKYLSDPVLASFSTKTSVTIANTDSSIGSITPEQVALLTPQQIRNLGSASDSTSVAKLQFLNIETFKRLVSDPIQVAAITVNEFKNLPSSYFALIGLNIKYLSDPVLASFSTTTSVTLAITDSQIGSITPEQVALLTPQQIRILGSASDNVSKFPFLKNNSLAKLFSDPKQVEAITPTEFMMMTSFDVPLLGENIKYLSDTVLANMKATFSASASNTMSQIQAITAIEISALSQNQIMIFAKMKNVSGNEVGISYFSVATFGSLTPSQVTQLTPSHVIKVTPAQLAALSTETLQALDVLTRQSFTTSQKSQLSATQLSLI